MKIFFVIICSVYLAGCLTSEKATNFLKKKDLLDDACAENYPVKDSLIKGDTILVTDTVQLVDIFMDTVVNNDTVFITKTLPAKIITKTFRVTDTVIRRDFAQENVLLDRVKEGVVVQQKQQAKIEQLQSEKEDLRKSRNKFRLWFWILIGAAGACTFLKIKRIF